MAHILIVEDDDANYLLSRTLLEEAGHDVVRAPNAEEAMSMLNLSPPDLVIMDIQLPQMDGLRLTREIKRRSDLSHIPVVAVSGNDRPADKARATAAGCDGLLSKPFDVHTFAKDVMDFLKTN